MPFKLLVEDVPPNVGVDVPLVVSDGLGDAVTLVPAVVILLSQGVGEFDPQEVQTLIL